MGNLSDVKAGDEVIIKRYHSWGSNAFATEQTRVASVQAQSITMDGGEEYWKSDGGLVSGHPPYAPSPRIAAIIKAERGEA